MPGQHAAIGWVIELSHRAMMWQLDAQRAVKFIDLSS